MTVSQVGQVPTVVDYTYDPAGYLMSVIDDQVAVHYNRIGAGDTYYSDPVGRTRRAEKQIIVAGVTTDVRYTYDVMGNITALSYPNGRVVTYDVNKVGELTGIGGAEGEPAYLSTPPVYENGLLKELTFGNGVRSVYDYDNNGRLTGIANQKGAEDIARFRYQYDNANNIIGKFDERDSYLGLPQNSLITFTLWPSSFRSAVYAYIQVQHRTEEYTYDAVGNRVKEDISHAYVESRTYQYYANSDRLKTDERFAFRYLWIKDITRPSLIVRDSTSISLLWLTATKAPVSVSR